MAGRLGMARETLRNRLRQAEVDAGDRQGVTTSTVREARQLKRKNADRERTVETLKKATSSFVGESNPQRR